MSTLTIRIPRELVSPNKWNGRHWRVKHRISQQWEADVFASSLGQRMRRAAFRMSTSGAVVRVAITREVPSGRNFIRDDDNLRFCVKPLLDAIKRLGYVRDDSRKWIELPTPEQKISTDGGYWTEIVLSAVGEPPAVDAVAVQRTNSAGLHRA